MSPGAWWRQYHLDKAERQEQQKQKRREDGRARRQLLGSTRTNRQLQQQPAFLDPQFTRHVKYAMEPTEEERRRLLEEGAGWKQRVVERYAHMQCMADRVNDIEHSEQCGRVVAWLQRLEELKQVKPTDRDYVGAKTVRDKRKAATKLDKAAGAKRPRKERQRDPPTTPSEPAQEGHTTDANKDEEDDIPLRPQHSAAVRPQLIKITVEQKEAAADTHSASSRAVESKGSASR